MLILTRYAGQKIMIGDDIVITVLPSLRNNKQVTLGIDCAKEIKIFREEIYTPNIEKAETKIRVIRKKLWGKA